MSIDRWIAESPSVVEAYDTTRPDFEAYVDEIDAWYQRRPGTYCERWTKRADARQTRPWPSGSR